MHTARPPAATLSTVHTSCISRDLEGLTDDLIVGQGRGSTPFGLYVFAAEQPESELARSIERAEAIGGSTWRRCPAVRSTAGSAIGPVSPFSRTRRV